MYIILLIWSMRWLEKVISDSKRHRSAKSDSKPAGSGTNSAEASTYLRPTMISVNTTTSGHNNCFYCIYFNMMLLVDVHVPCSLIEMRLMAWMSGGSTLAHHFHARPLSAHASCASWVHSSGHDTHGSLHTHGTSLTGFNVNDSPFFTRIGSVPGSQ